MKRVLNRATLLSIGLGFGVLAALPADAADKVTWTWSLYGPPRAATVTFEHLAKVAKEKSDGNFIINLKYNEQLGEAKDFLDGIKVDSFQGAFVAYSYAPAKTPLQGVLDMPFLPISDLVGQERVQDAYQAWKPVADELAQMERHSLHDPPAAAVRVHGHGQAAAQPRGLEGHAGARAGRPGRRHEAPGRGADIGVGAGSLHRARARHVPGGVVPLHLQLHRLQAARSVEMVHARHAARHRAQFGGAEPDARGRRCPTSTRRSWKRPGPRPTACSAWPTRRPTRSPSRCSRSASSRSSR